MKWVQKITEGGQGGRFTACVVLDADARRLRIPLAGVTEADAAAMVATGDWKYVYDASRPLGVQVFERPSELA